LPVLLQMNPILWSILLMTWRNFKIVVKVLISMVMVSKTTPAIGSMVSRPDAQATISNSSQFSVSKYNSKSSLPLFSVNNSRTILATALWHFRLGHLSHLEFLRCLKCILLLPMIINNKLVCDICHFARHKKLPYVSSFSRGNHKLELLQFDIWGPLSIFSVRWF
jgi:hypothetical protein